MFKYIYSLEKFSVKQVVLRQIVEQTTQTIVTYFTEFEYVTKHINFNCWSKASKSIDRINFALVKVLKSQKRLIEYTGISKQCVEPRCNYPRSHTSEKV